jgi:predicted  nucleic acid-binding Zn-ribbon protein
MEIDIKRELKLLRELQAIDIKVREIEEKLSEIPNIISEAKAPIDKLEEEIKSKREEKARIEKEKRILEMELEASAEHLRDREAKLYTIKTNREYQAALKEIADGKKANREKEDIILKLMERSDALSREIEQLLKEQGEKKAMFEEEENRLKADASKLEKDKEALATELESHRAKIDKKILNEYDSLREYFLDPVAVANGEMCGGCNVNIPPQMYIELLKCTKLHFCPACHRILVIEEREEDEQKQEEA